MERLLMGPTSSSALFVSRSEFEEFAALLKLLRRNRGHFRGTRKVGMVSR
jgi:hypothetical protein